MTDAQVIRELRHCGHGLEADYCPASIEADGCIVTFTLLPLIGDGAILTEIKAREDKLPSWLITPNAPLLHYTLGVRLV